LHFHKLACRLVRPKERKNARNKLDPMTDYTRSPMQENHKFSEDTKIAFTFCSSLYALCVAAVILSPFVNPKNAVEKKEVLKKFSFRIRINKLKRKKP